MNTVLWIILVFVALLGGFYGAHTLPANKWRKNWLKILV